MKYAIIIPDGCADEPQPSLGGNTPLQAADTSNMDRLAQTGVVGAADNVPGHLTPASDVATLSLFGYDPAIVYTGRAPLEAVAMGLQLGPNDWAIRCNFVTIEEGRMRDFTAGHIGNEDGAAFIAALNDMIAGADKEDRLEFHAGVSYRNILIYRGDGAAPFSEETQTQAPHDIPDRPAADYLPKGPGSDLLNDLMRRSQTLLAEHTLTKERKAKGKKPATQIWLWGQGRAPTLRSFADVYGQTGAIVSAVDLVRGVGMLIGWKRIDVPGATGYLDTDYAAKGAAGIKALDDVDLVCIHVEAPDEASHEGRAEAKVQALQEIDCYVVGPMLNALQQYDGWRILVSPDHRTYLRTRAHAHGAVPFVVAGKNVDSQGQASYDELTAEKSTLQFSRGHELMKWFLS